MKLLSTNVISLLAWTSAILPSTIAFPTLLRREQSSGVSSTRRRALKLPQVFESLFQEDATAFIRRLDGTDGSIPSFSFSFSMSLPSTPPTDSPADYLEAVSPSDGPKDAPFAAPTTSTLNITTKGMGSAVELEGGSEGSTAADEGSHDGLAPGIIATTVVLSIAAALVVGLFIASRRV
jgi:hypothetical protein